MEILKRKKQEDIRPSNGPPPGMPFFHTTGIGTGEIMAIEEATDEGMVVVYYEDPEEPGRLHSDTLHKEDLADAMEAWTTESSKPKSV